MIRKSPVAAGGSNGQAAAATGRALIVCPLLRNGAGSNRSSEARLAEAAGLARAIRLHVVDAEAVRTDNPRPATLFGTGTVERLQFLIAEQDIGVVVVDGTLSPIQQRNLERAWKCKVIDRTGLILEIFGDRARTSEGRLQVELAALTYQKSRLVRSWTHLERQRGGFGFLGGPGESQIESDRRQIGDRIIRLKRELGAVTRTRGLHREARRRVPYPVIALVGYTNAGKSTLFNRLTESRVFADNLLFATLDPTMRAIKLPQGPQAILSDTVGFISNLPTGLVAAFRATLEEVRAADVIVHVRDVSHADAEAQKNDVEEVLGDLGLGRAVDAGLLEALNKIDLLAPSERGVLANQAARNPNLIPISAATGEGVDHLLAAVARRLQAERHVVDLAVDLTDGASIAWLYRHGQVLARRDDAEFAHFRVGLLPADLAKFEHRTQAH
ncbi:MAG TPA: GTPase HflX [Alphaproteobacteria bacterium]|nr:GTPase HflX [Alphaproteobacteria bacterium]